ncbi:restriction endonuclease [Novosphingobium sp. Chol11]|jgi:hypothetical protein|uniref:restriction endonuclease n=1 Tax=Novosphingobium sp. Chol11 TaxID=1385763 RepID=UPI000BE26D46|nr:hypothetical protein [Novosphingobium sp. Chol11]
MSRDDSGKDGAKIGRCPVRYIKLGSGGRWESTALREGTLEWGSEADPGELARATNWDDARQHYLQHGASPSTATGYTRELRDFFTLGSDTLWITFARDQLWWAFAEPEVGHRGVATADHASFFRRTIGPWRSNNILGEPLIQHRLSSALTKVASYPQAMCRVEAEDYLFRLINAELDEAVLLAQSALEGLHANLEPVIRQLHWQDFELLIDLIFSRSGWRRVSRLGGTLKDHDLLLEQPITAERISVQVKSTSSQRVLDRYAKSFNDNDVAHRLFFISHDEQALASPDPRIITWSVSDVSRQTVAAGLTDWLMERAA